MIIAISWRKRSNASNSSSVTAGESPSNGSSSSSTRTSPAITEELFEAFNRLRYEIAMVIVDHHLDLALALSDRTVILERGSVTWTGASKLLRDDLELRRQKLWM